MPLRHTIASLGADYAAFPQMAGRDHRMPTLFPLWRFAHAGETVRPDRYRGLPAGASLSLAVSDRGVRKNVAASFANEFAYVRERRVNLQSVATTNIYLKQTINAESSQF